MFADPCIIVKFIKKNPTRCNNVSKFYYSIFVVVGHVDGGRCQAHTAPDNIHHLYVQQPPMHEKPEAASAVLGS
jgi:hypothetical protein